MNMAALFTQLHCPAIPCGTAAVPTPWNSFLVSPDTPPLGLASTCWTVFLLDPSPMKAASSGFYYNNLPATVLGLLIDIVRLCSLSCIL
jgi:hypothetical protein